MQNKLPLCVEKLLELWAPQSHGIPELRRKNDRKYDQMHIRMCRIESYIYIQLSSICRIVPHHLRPPHSALHQKQIHAFLYILLDQPAAHRNKIR